MIAARILAASPHDALRDGDRALVLAQRLVAARRNSQSLETLAMALAEPGRFAEAARVQREAITLAKTSGRGDLVRLRSNLARYEKNERCRDPALSESG